MAAVRPVEVNEKGHSVYRWSAEWPECCWWKADEHTLVLAVALPTGKRPAPLRWGVAPRN